MDEHSVRLLDNVDPPEWIDPIFDGTHHLAVARAVAGGLVISSGAAGVAEKAAPIEEDSLEVIFLT